jgi:hypothetical protein
MLRSAARQVTHHVGSADKDTRLVSMHMRSFAPAADRAAQLLVRSWTPRRSPAAEAFETRLPLADDSGKMTIRIIVIASF